VAEFDRESGGGRGSGSAAQEIGGGGWKTAKISQKSADPPDKSTGKSVSGFIQKITGKSIKIGDF
jgi:hypothetical protein